MAENSGDFLGLMNAGTKKEYENFKQMMQIQDIKTLKNLWMTWIHTRRRESEC